MNNRLTCRACIVAFALMAMCVVALPPSRGVSAAKARRPVVLVHYRPWFAAKPASQNWGWHWTMNTFDPEKQTQGKRSIASHYYPLIGPYDFGDPRSNNSRLAPDPTG